MVRAVAHIGKQRLSAALASGPAAVRWTQYPLDPPVPPTPRHELAAAAYAHACAVLGQTPAATEAAVLAVRRGGRSLATVLGHARDAALEREDHAVRIDTGAPAPSDLDELAHHLAFLRPAAERAVVDLDARHGLDQAGLGQALGMSASAASAHAGEVAGEWQRTLDPVLLAKLGPGSCDELAGVLEGEVADEGGPLADLLAAGERVAAHAESCELCGDRLRAMVSVRTLLAQRPLPEVPSAVLDAAAVARLRASSLPPPLLRVRTAARRRLPVVVASAAVIVAGVTGAFLTRDGDAPESQVEAVTKLPAASNALAVRPASVRDAVSTVSLRNLRDQPTPWTATADQPWILVEPAEGNLDANGSTTVRIRVGAGAAEGDVKGSVTFTGADGSTAIARVDSTIATPPDVAATREACVVTATVEDESELAAVVLHQRSAPPIPMRATGTEGAYTAELAGGGGAWWVTATDAFGNEGRTAEQPLGSGC